MSILLERALAAEEERDEARGRISDLEQRLIAVLGSDPTSASRALSWMSRAENSETLLRELAVWLENNKSVGDLLPSGFATRLRTQLKTVEILKRDQAALAEKPPEGEWWGTAGADAEMMIKPTPIPLAGRPDGKAIIEPGSLNVMAPKFDKQGRRIG